MITAMSDLIQGTLFAMLPIDYMRHAHGVGPEGMTCLTCSKRAGMGKDCAWFSCIRFPVEQGRPDDWDGSWPVCGLYARPVHRQLEKRRKNG